MNNYYLGIDIGGTNVKYALLNRAGKIIEQDKIKTATEKEDFLQDLDKIVAKYQNKGLKGIGFCAPGKIVDATIHFGGALPFLDGIDLEQRYHNLNLPVAGVNDGKASVLAESWLGNLKDCDNCAAITLGTGVGGGIIVNGKLVLGTHSQAGELSFMQLNLKEPDFNGFAGMQCSAVRMINEVNKAVNNKELNDGLAAFTAINNGSSAATTIFNAYCKKIAVLILNLQSVLDLEKVAIGGGISAQPIVISTINTEYSELLNSNELIKNTLTPVRIVEAKFKNSANIYGALYNLLLKINQEEI